LEQTTRAQYADLVNRFICPELGDATLLALSPTQVDAWHAGIARRTPSTAAKAYRLLGSIMRSAVDDQIIARSPCRLKGGGKEIAEERPTATVAEVAALADAAGDEHRIAVLLAAWCALRRSEILGLRRRDVDLVRATVEVVRTRVKPHGGPFVEKFPKTTAGRRILALPGPLVPELSDHLDRFVGPAPGDLMFPRGYNPLRTAWDRARREVGVSYHLHDLRHTGLTLAAAAGATVAELMHRGGHSTPASAMRYQHASVERDRVIADAMAPLLPLAQVVSIDTARQTSSA
jgi:integrase